MTRMTKRDKAQFELYLRQCTDDQVKGVYERECVARRFGYANLARYEAAQRCIALADHAGGPV